MNARRSKGSSSRDPPQECEGYPPVVILNHDARKEFGFYIDVQDPDPQAPVPRKLACTWVTANEVPFEELDWSITGLPHPKLRRIDRSIGVVVICHGKFTWRNSMFLANLGYQLGTTGTASGRTWHTLRFDFSGNGHSTSTSTSTTEWKFEDWDTMYADLRAVVDFLVRVNRCQVACIVGHSQGSTAMLRTAAFLQQQQQQQQKDLQKDLPCYVNLSGRCTGPNHSNAAPYSETFSDDELAELQKQGTLSMTRSMGRVFVAKAEDVFEKRYQVDLVDVCARLREASSSSSFPTRPRILTIHGQDDEVNSVENAYQFDKLLTTPHSDNSNSNSNSNDNDNNNDNNRSTHPIHTLKIIPKANHNFNGLKYLHEIVSAIAAFIDAEGK